MAVENALAFLRALDSRRNLPPSIIVFGPQAFLREAIVTAIANLLRADGYQYRSFRIGADATFSTVVDEMRGADLFAPNRLIVCSIPRAHRDREGESVEADVPAPASGGEAELAAAMQDERGPNHVLIVSERDTVPAKIRRAGEKSPMVNCLRPFDNQLPEYAQVLARLQGLKLGPGAAEFLVIRHADDLAAISNALGKAAISSEGQNPITPEDLNDPGSIKVPDAFEIAESIARGRTSVALAQLDRALALGRDPFEILGVEVIPQLRRMMVAAALLSRKRGAGEVAAALGMAPTSGLVARAVEGARRLGFERVQRAYLRVAELDESFKNGMTKERGQALSALVLELLS